ncbi:MAG: phosphatidylserine decarboxylase family protein [Candidatus Omnitrophica bacterium]|nr:phosphatidylserine decarboxylase family protein [Candidatus Omnitrophota bacterium]
MKKLMILAAAIFVLCSGIITSANPQQSSTVEFHPVIKEFNILLQQDPIVRMYVTEMIDQLPEGQKNVKDVNDFLSQLNQILTTAPKFSKGEVEVTPLSNLLVGMMNTPAGFHALRNEKINNMLRKILKTWAEFLNSEKSLYVLNDSPGGWKSKEAQKFLKMDDYLYDPNDRYWGYKSWNDFFTRKVKPSARPIAQPDNNKIIISPCDTTIFNISYNVKKVDKFWIKSQPYSLQDMLDNSPYTDEFVGGSVIQGFLSPFNYHRWNSPVSGTIVMAYVKDGLYFSQAESQGVDPSAQDKSQGYLAHVQTRALIFIKADDPEIGLMCFMPVGMVEVSSCIIDPKIKPGYHVKKGEDLGYFQFGGSTQCLIFRKGAIKKFTAVKGRFYKMGEEIAIAN